MDSEVSCDICNGIFESGDLFWRDAGVDTEEQYQVSQYLTENEIDVCCEFCFGNVLKISNIALSSNRQVPLNI